MAAVKKCYRITLNFHELRLCQESGQVHLRPQIAVNLRAIQRSLQNADRPYRDVVEELRYGTPGKRGEIA